MGRTNSGYARTTKRSGPPLAQRTIVLASADEVLRGRLSFRLIEMRWSVREAGSGGETFVLLEAQQPEVLLLDHWLPDLDVLDLGTQLLRFYPELNLLHMDGQAANDALKSPRRQELLHALRAGRSDCLATPEWRPSKKHAAANDWGEHAKTQPQMFALPAMIGQSEPILELARLIRLIAPRSTAVLIEGETGAGKEVVANALHRLSSRASKPMVVLNCATIPEALLEAELFGHTRGAFTGAVDARVGLIETAHGGTLFLDEIGELPLMLQAKMLRFLECGELQRVGDNAVTQIDVRVIAATHQDLEQRASEGTFRLDLYHRLAVFPVYVPALRERKQDIPALVEFLLARLGKNPKGKRLSQEALDVLEGHHWPGNVRELAHVLERAVILSEEDAVIEARHIRYRRKGRV